MGQHIDALKASLHNNLTEVAESFRIAGYPVAGFDYSILIDTLVDLLTDLLGGCLSRTRTKEQIATDAVEWTIFTRYGVRMKLRETVDKDEFLPSYRAIGATFKQSSPDQLIGAAQEFEDGVADMWKMWPTETE